MSRRKAPEGKPVGMWILDGAPSYKRGREGFETPKEAVKLAELEADDQCKEHGCAKWRCDTDGCNHGDCEAAAREERLREAARVAHEHRHDRDSDRD